MDLVAEWDGQLACALQRALRMNDETFAERLGVHTRTVAMWRQKPSRIPNSELQQALDTVLERADGNCQKRFAILVSAMGRDSAPSPGRSTGSPGDDLATSSASSDDLTDSAASATIAGDSGDKAAGEGFMSWLQVVHDVTAPPDGSDVGQVLRWYRKHKNLTQQDVAKLLNTTQSRLSKLEKGTQALRDVTELRYIARKLGIPPERFGVLPDQSRDANPFPSHVSDRPGEIRDSQENWRNIRRELNAHRAVLAELAAELYPQEQRIPGTTVIALPDWVPDGPVDLDDIKLAWRPDPPAPQVDGRGTPSAGARPLMASGERYDRYSRALRDLARPRLFDNRVSYRLLDVDWSGSRGTLGFHYTSFFNALDVREAAAHEFAQAWLAAGRKRPSLAELPFRRSIADPLDLSARPVLPGIATLTIRRDPIAGHRMYLHHRDAKAVASGGGTYGVIPAGEFQPAALAPAHQNNDFSLWRNIQREFSEEFLGKAEHDGNSIDPIAYDTDEPFASFERARQSGDFRVFACAMVCGPLTLTVVLVTVAVIEAPVFDALFAGMVALNEEGAMISTEAGRPTVGIPFTAAARERLRAEPLAQSARPCIEMAWQHRHQLLGR